MPKYSLEYQNWTIIFGIKLMQRHLLFNKEIAIALYSSLKLDLN